MPLGRWIVHCRLYLPLPFPLGRWIVHCRLYLPLSLLSNSRASVWARRWKASARRQNQESGGAAEKTGHTYYTLLSVLWHGSAGSTEMHSFLALTEGGAPQQESYAEHRSRLPFFWGGCYSAKMLFIIVCQLTPLEPSNPYLYFSPPSNFVPKNGFPAGKALDIWGFFFHRVGHSLLDSHIFE